MLAKVDEALLSGNATGDSPRDSFFELQRPPSHHLWAPSGHDLSTHAFAACCGDFVLEPEMDDEGGNSYMPSGRISPCTFLAWSKGCRRWNKPNIAPDDVSIIFSLPPLGAFPGCSFLCCRISAQIANPQLRIVS